nr:MAG TPA_asm: hypothetical protein [Caudoviricetes sp.]DAT32608.1 MAG TPA: hypothetical protein [Caudoviricetes sp.]
MPQLATSAFRGAIPIASGRRGGLLLSVPPAPRKIDAFGAL